MEPAPVARALEAFVASTLAWLFLPPACFVRAPPAFAPALVAAVRQPLGFAAALPGRPRASPVLGSARARQNRYLHLADTVGRCAGFARPANPTAIVPAATADKDCSPACSP